jgi:translation initiation factor 4G
MVSVCLIPSPSTQSPMQDLTPRYVPNRFASPTTYDQSSAPEQSVNYSNRDLGNADKFLDRPVVHPPPARAQETALSQNTSSEKGLSDAKLQNMSMAAIKEYYRYHTLFACFLFPLFKHVPIMFF